MITKTDHCALVTGGSRGVGARVAQLLAESGSDVAITYRNKAARAQEVISGVEATGRKGFASQSDMTVESDLEALMASLRESFGKLDLLVLNASGGMEKGKGDDYALLLNRTAQSRMVDHALPLMPEGSLIVFVTSHPAHFYPERPVYEAYETVASSKRAGEDALRARIPELAERGIRLIVVSGDLIEDTITAKLLDRSAPGLIEFRRNQAGALPTIDEFARGIVAASQDETLASGDTVFVGSTEY